MLGGSFYLVREAGGPLRESGSVCCRGLPAVWPGPPDKEPRSITAKMEQQIPKLEWSGGLASAKLLD